MLSVAEFKKRMEYGKKYFLNDVKDFLAFVIAAIIGTLIFYKQTQDELTATLILSVLWLFFWRESDLQGKVFLITASVIGYIHELIGVQAGFFTYLGGFFGGVPLWVLPGYGAIFWASYHFWIIFEEHYRNEKSSRFAPRNSKLLQAKRAKWFSRIPAISVGIAVMLLAIDSAFFDFLGAPAGFFGWFILSLLLFRKMSDVRLAYFVAVFTVFDEIAGELLGVWSHPRFSIFSLMGSYIILLWMSITIKEILSGTKKWHLVEVISALVLFARFLWEVWLGMG